MPRYGVQQGGVYPRVCGGTKCAGVSIPQLRGLSPRVRGNLSTQLPQWASVGSIPACAGEPQDRLMKKR